MKSAALVTLVDNAATTTELQMAKWAPNGQTVMRKIIMMKRQKSESGRAVLLLSHVTSRQPRALAGEIYEVNIVVRYSNKASPSLSQS